MNQAEITALKFPDNVRLRKEMYLIDPNHCIYEIIDNSVDEHVAGRCNVIKVSIQEKNEEFVITISDDGGGIPTAMSKDPDHKGRCQAEVALGTLSASGKYGTEHGYKTATSGLHGVGASCVNAVSEFFDAEIVHHGKKTNLHYEKGVLKKKSIDVPFEDTEAHGTTIVFQLDKTLWKDEQYNLDVVRRRLKQLAYLNPGLTIEWNKQISSANAEHGTFYHENGLKEYYEDITTTKQMVNFDPILLNKIVKNDEVGDIQISICFGYSHGYSSEYYSFVNNVSTQAGDHVIGFNTGISKAIQNFFGNSDKFKTLSKNLTSDDCKEGLVAIISVKVMAPKFEGQSKASIKMPEVRSAVYNSVLEDVTFYMDQHPIFVKSLADKLEKAVKARIAAKKAREAVRSAKNTLESSLPGKLAACSCKDPSLCEIYLVEGDSAAGSAIQARDNKTQAILPVFGKILNAEKSRESEVISNSKLLDVVKALRCGIGKSFDISKLRYHRIVLMADADVDGFHITTLWITFFYRYMPEIIEKGYLYIATPPLYKVTEGTGKKETFKYFFDDKALEAYKAKAKGTYHISYLKGLGEMQPQQLWDSTLDPAKRRMIQVTCDDSASCCKAIEICMGNDVEIRKNFILENVNFEEVHE